MTSTAQTTHIGVDIGGTKIIAGVVDGRGRVLSRATRPSPPGDADEVRDGIVAVVEELLGQGWEPRAVGVGAAGWMDAANTTVVFSPHLSWRNEPLLDKLSRRIPLPVAILNDADAAALAEWTYGAGRGSARMVCLTLGTGIGGAVVMDGRVERGKHGLAGEFGHMVIFPDGHRCECGKRGCWEQYASGNALGREARLLAESRSPVAHRLLELVDGDPAAITGRTVTQAAREGDRASLEMMEEIGRWLGLGIANLAAALDPEVFVVGGGVSAAGDLFLDSARAAFRRNLTGGGYRPEASIVPATLGPEAGLVGAAVQARTVFGQAG